MACKEDVNLSASSDSLERLCAICVYPINDPRLLTCLHAFCRQCIDELAVTGQEETVSCPLCRTVCDLPSEGAATLPQDVSYNTAAHSSECSLCSETGRNRNPTVWCGECKAAFCNDHAVSHVLSSGHAISHLPDTSGPLSGVAISAVKTRLCPEHLEPLTLFCKRCGEVVCGHCAVYGSHAQHKPVVPMREIEAEREEAVAANVEKLRSEVLPLKEKSLNAFNDVSKELADRVDAVREAIRACGDRAVNAVQTCIEQRLQEVDDVETARRKVLDEKRGELKRDIEAIRRAISLSDRVFGGKTASASNDRACVLLALDKRVLSFLNDPEVKGDYSPRCHARLGFTPVHNDILLKEADKLIGKVKTLDVDVCAEKCRLVGDPPKIGMRDEKLTFVVEARDANEEVLTHGEFQLVSKWSCVPSGAVDPPSVDVERQDKGEFRLSFTPQECGQHVLKLSIDGKVLPFTLSINVVNPGTLTFDPQNCGHEFVTSEDLRTVTHTANRYNFVVGSMGMRRGQHSWKVSVQSPTGKTEDHLIGVISRKTADPAKHGGLWQGLRSQSYQWNNKGHRRIMGAYQQQTPLSKFENGDIIQLDLDCDLHTLKITNRRTQTSDFISNLPDEELLPYFCLYYAGSSFTLLT